MNIDLTDNIPWVLNDEEIAIAEEQFWIHASESGMTLDHSDNELDEEREFWLQVANAEEFARRNNCEVPLIIN